MKSSAAFILRFLLVASGLLFIAGCLPSGLPAYVNGGKTIVATALDENGKLALWTYDVETKKATSHTPPGGYELHAAIILGDQIWARVGDSLCLRFDPIKNQFLSGGQDTVDQALDQALPASFDGKKCLLIPNGETDGTFNYEVLTYPEFEKKTTTLNLNKVLAVGDFWWITLSDRIVVHDQDGKRVHDVLPSELQKITELSGIPYARINANDKTLLLTFTQTQGWYSTYGIFDLTTGKFIWGGSSEETLKGIPLFDRNVIWSLQNRRDHQPIRLIKHRPGKNESDGKRELVIEIPLALRQFPGEYTASPDGSHFVLVINGKPSRLLFIPLKEGITEKDITTVDLVAEKNPASK